MTAGHSIKNLRSKISSKKPIASISKSTLPIYHIDPPYMINSMREPEMPLNWSISMHIMKHWEKHSKVLTIVLKGSIIKICMDICHFENNNLYHAIVSIRPKFHQKRRSLSSRHLMSIINTSQLCPSITRKIKRTKNIRQKMSIWITKGHRDKSQM